MTRRGAAALLGVMGLSLVWTLPAMAGLRLPLISRDAQVAKREMALGDWRLTITTGTFSHDKACHLEDRRHRITYASGALGFRFGRGVHTSGAWVRIDDGEVQRWRDDWPELVHLGVALDGSRLDNPSEGIVWVPARQLDEANAITIQPDAHRRPVTFHLHGFAGLRDMARDMGCVPDARFTPDPYFKP